jgi:hypothetical protein
MSQASVQQAQDLPQTSPVAAPDAGACTECLGSGGWFRFEPELEPAPGMVYLSCLQCRGSGRLAQPRAGVLRPR